MAEADLLPPAIDEFGPLERIVLPGQRAEDLAAIIAAVGDELKPASFIERMMARDFALQIAFAEYLRMAKRSLLGELLERSAGGADGTEGAGLGKVIAEHLAVVEGMARLEVGICNERDRIAKRFDDRRLETLHRALALLEGGAGASAASDVLMIEHDDEQG